MISALCSSYFCVLTRSFVMQILVLRWLHPMRLQWRSQALQSAWSPAPSATSAMVNLRYPSLLRSFHISLLRIIRKFYFGLLSRHVTCGTCESLDLPTTGVLWVETCELILQIAAPACATAIVINRYNGINQQGTSSTPQVDLISSRSLTCIEHVHCLSALSEGSLLFEGSPACHSLRQHMSLS